MNKSCVFISAVVIAGLMFGLACAEKTPSEETTAGAPEQATRDSSPGTLELAQGNAEAQTSESAYAALMGDIRDLQKSPSAREDVERTVQKIEAMLAGFIAEWPDSPESSDAKFQLGAMFSSMMQPNKAIPYLTEFLENDPKTNDNRTATSHYFLAESYKSANRFDDAKKHYQVVIDKYPVANTKLLAMARNNLNNLDVMKRLAIGGEPIPFEVKDMEGNTLSLEKYKGKVVLLDFWATWCGPCRQEMPNVKRVYNKYSKDGFEIVGISLDQRKDQVESYLKKYDVKWPNHFDGKGWNNGVAQKYKVSSIPATYLIDRQGKIRYKSLRGNALDQAVAEPGKEN